jgi:hypothetical protein
MFNLRHRRLNWLYSLEEKSWSVHSLGRNAVTFQAYAVQEAGSYTMRQSFLTPYFHFYAHVNGHCDLRDFE